MSPPKRRTPQSARASHRRAPTGPASNILGTGWYLRRCRNTDLLAHWYGGVLRLPLIRGRHPTHFFWAGDTAVIELIGDVPPDKDRHVDPETAPTAPGFLTVDLDALVRRLRRSRARVIGRRAFGGGQEAWVLDADDQLICLRELAAPSRAWEKVLKAYWSDAERFNPGCSMMPPDISGWAWVLRRVPDLRAEVEFYRDIVGFPLLTQSSDGASFSIGPAWGPPCVLELATGGARQPPVKTRTLVTNSFVTHVENHRLMNRQLKERGAAIVNDHIQFNSAELTYVASPAGHLTGFEERYEPHEFGVPRIEFAEDAEFERRYRAWQGD